MHTLELLVDRTIEDGRFVVTNNSATGVPIGSVFTSLSSRQVGREGESFTEEPISTPVQVSLQLAGIESWRQPINELPKGHSAAVRLRGTGLDLLKQLLVSREKFVYVFLAGGEAEA